MPISSTERLNRVSRALDEIFLKHGDKARDIIGTDMFYDICDKNWVEPSDVEDAILEAFEPDDWDVMHGH